MVLLYQSNNNNRIMPVSFDHNGLPLPISPSHTRPTRMPNRMTKNMNCARVQALSQEWNCHTMTPVLEPISRIEEEIEITPMPVFLVRFVSLDIKLNLVFKKI